MRVDLFRRPEVGGQFSYLAVPHGRPIPQEAANTDWELVLQDAELSSPEAQASGLEPADAEQQISDKGYAITSIADLHDVGEAK